LLREDDPSTELWRLVRGIYRTALKRLNARLAKERVSFSQYSVLLALARRGPMQMNKLGENMLVAPANVTGLVDRMEKKGYVRRRRDEADRRLYMIEPTPLGVKTFERISERFQSYVRSIGKDLSQSERSAVVASLSKVLAAVEGSQEI
jgi:MarR family 2-MHQ and catechol resistance regulon transcriptional repressor